MKDVNKWGDAMRQESIELLNHLNEVNDVKIYSVEDEEFSSYGRIVKGYDFSDITKYMKENTSIPADGNVYEASVKDMEAFPVKKKIEAGLYGGMPIQIGYCNGRNSTYNGFEYHKGSEINVAVTDFMLVLGHRWEIKNNHYDNKDAKVFFVERGCAIEMFETTLHLSPLKVSEDGFKGVVILPKGTNTPLTDEDKKYVDQKDSEQILLLQRNKWVIAHPKREPLIKQGAHPGIIGENKELFF